MWPYLPSVGTWRKCSDGYWMHFTKHLIHNWTFTLSSRGTVFLLTPCQPVFIATPFFLTSGQIILTAHLMIDNPIYPFPNQIYHRHSQPLWNKCQSHNLGECMFSIHSDTQKSLHRISPCPFCLLTPEKWKSSLQIPPCTMTFIVMLSLQIKVYMWKGYSLLH